MLNYLSCPSLYTFHPLHWEEDHTNQPGLAKDSQTVHSDKSHDKLVEDKDNPSIQGRRLHTRTKQHLDCNLFEANSS